LRRDAAFRFPVAAAIASMLRIQSYIFFGLTICPLEATAPTSHFSTQQEKRKALKRRKILSLIVAYCGFQHRFRILVMADAKVPSKFMITETLVSVSWISVSIRIFGMVSLADPSVHGV